MQYRFLLLFVLVFSLSTLSAQRLSNRFWEAGALFGATNYSGDLTERYVELSETQPGFGFFVRYHTGNLISLKAHIYSGSISGDDKNTRNAVRKYRFGTSIFEMALVGEWKLLPRDRISSTGIFRPRLDPYLFAGLGYTIADAKAEYYGSTPNKDLRVPLPEEGLKNRFLLTPIGAGLRAEVSEWLVLGFEGGLRPVFSDDLDGMRINGNADKNDWYYFGGLTVSVIINGNN